MRSLSSKAEQPAWERSRDSGKTWEPCTGNDVRLAVGQAGLRETRCGNTVTSEHGVRYRRRDET